MALVRAEVDIDAPAEAIWEILTDLESYAEWNPFAPWVDSTRHDRGSMCFRWIRADEHPQPHTRVVKLSELSG